MKFVRQPAGIDEDSIVEFDEDGFIRAAGGIVVRFADDCTVQVLLIHRTQYDDWSLPKGKTEGRETDAETARREVWEEVGMRCHLGAHVGSVPYRDRFDRAKRAKYWLMTPLSDETATPGDGVDAVIWVEWSDVPGRLSRSRDVDFFEGLDEALAEEWLARM